MARTFWQIEFPVGDALRGAAYRERTDPITIAVASTIGGAVLSKVMAPKIDKPGTPERIPTLTETEADKQARSSQKKQRQAAAAAVGRGDTILTQGLGSAESTGNAAVKTILGL